MDRNEWNAPWTNRTRWIFEHLQEFNLTPQEALGVLLISLCNDTNQSVTMETLMEKGHIDADAMEEVFEGLSSKGYLTVTTKGKSICFVLEGLLDTPIKAGTPLNHTLLQEFQEEFRRTFSSSEMDRILELGNKYDERMVLQALSEAAAYEKRSLGYIESILASWVRKGLTAEDVEAGRR